MTPLHIQLMLHYHTRAEPYAINEPCHANSPAVLEYRRYLQSHDMIEPCSYGWRSTDKGQAYVEALCAVQIPICKWVQP